MSEKTKEIKNGENIELDGEITVLNNVSVAEKTPEEVVVSTEENDEKEIKPDVKIPNEEEENEPIIPNVASLEPNVNVPNPPFIPEPPTPEIPSVLEAPVMPTPQANNASFEPQVTLESGFNPDFSSSFNPGFNPNPDSVQYNNEQSNMYINGNNNFNQYDQNNQVNFSNMDFSSIESINAAQEKLINDLNNIFVGIKNLRAELDNMIKNQQNFIDLLTGNHSNTYNDSTRNNGGMNNRFM